MLSRPTRDVVVLSLIHYYCLNKGVPPTPKWVKVDSSTLQQRGQTTIPSQYHTTLLFLSLFRLIIRVARRPPPPRQLANPPPHIASLGHNNGGFCPFGYLLCVNIYERVARINETVPFPIQVLRLCVITK